MKKVLIITYYWPPSGGAGVQRWLKFAKYLPEFGYQPYIYTPENPEAPVLDESLGKDVPKSAVVVKKRIIEPYSFYKIILGKKGKVSTGFLAEKKQKKEGLIGKITRFIRGNFFIPDARKFWIRPSAKFLKRYIQENNIDLIISTGPPHSMHLIARRLKRKTKVKWIADFRDPWTNIDFYKDLLLTKYADRMHHRMEKSVLKEADRVLVVGNAMKQEFEDISGRQIDVVTNGYDLDDVEDCNIALEEKFTISHVGSINGDRNHEIFGDALGELCKQNLDFAKDLKLSYIGKVDFSVKESMNKNKLESKVEYVDYVPHNQVSKLLRSARVLYLPLNNTPNAKGILTGKFFEYLAAKRPILAIGSEDGDLSKILFDTQSGMVVDFYDKEKLKSTLLEYYGDYKKGVCSFSFNNIEKYSRYNLTKRIVEEVMN